MKQEFKENEIVYCKVVANVKLETIKKLTYKNERVSWLVYDRERDEYDFISEDMITNDSSKYDEYKKRIYKKLICKLKPRVNDIATKILTKVLEDNKKKD